MQPLILPLKGKTPTIHPTAFIAPGAVIIGDVTIGKNSSVWYGCVLRGDENAIIVGEGSNIQDGTVIHVDDPNVGGVPTLIGNNVLVGHKCMLHGATVEDDGFVGMGATMLDGSVIEGGGFLAAGAFLAPKKRVPAGEMWAGSPARKFRDLKPGEDQWVTFGCKAYIAEAEAHQSAIKDQFEKDNNS